MDELTFQRKMQDLMARIKAMPETATAEASASVDQAGERR